MTTSVKMLIAIYITVSPLKWTAKKQTEKQKCPRHSTLPTLLWQAILPLIIGQLSLPETKTRLRKLTKQKLSSMIVIIINVITNTVSSCSQITPYNTLTTHRTRSSLHTHSISTYKPHINLGQCLHLHITSLQSTSEDLPINTLFPRIRTVPVQWFLHFRH